jgi:hypothetical protein
MNSTDDRWLRQQLRRGIIAQPSQMLNPRVLASLTFACLPAPARIAINRLAQRVRPTPENTNLVQDY